MFSRKPSDDSTIVDLLASSLRRDIAFGTLLPDQKLKLNELRTRYGGSNHSMRETLRILSSEGLVEATAQRGFRVTSATQDDVRDIVMVRCEVEKLALSRAIKLGDIAWEGRVMAAHHALQKTEAAAANYPDDLVALEWDEACRAFSYARRAGTINNKLSYREDNMTHLNRRKALALMGGTVAAAGLSAPAYAQNKTIKVGALRFTSHRIWRCGLRCHRSLWRVDQSGRKRCDQSHRWRAQRRSWH